jgi:periplasmic copper chaperone A
VQAYSDRTVIEWNQLTPASGEEPQHRAPTFTVVAATSSEAGAASASPSSAASTASSSAPADNAPAAASVGGSDTTAQVLGRLALLVGIITVAVAALGMRR